MSRHVCLGGLWIICATLACDSPAGPGPLEPPIGGRGPAGSTVKVIAPTAVSPGNNQVAGSLTPTLRASNARGIFTTGLPVSLVFEVLDDRDLVVYRSDAIVQDPSGGTGYDVAVPLAAGGTFSWRATAILDGRPGPPSNRATFRTPGNPGPG